MNADRADVDQAPHARANGGAREPCSALGVHTHELPARVSRGLAEDMRSRRQVDYHIDAVDCGPPIGTRPDLTYGHTSCIALRPGRADRRSILVATRTEGLR